MKYETLASMQVLVKPVVLLLIYLLSLSASVQAKRRACPTRQCRCKRQGKAADIRCVLSKTGGKFPRFRSSSTVYRTLLLNGNNFTEIPERAFRHVTARSLDISENPVGDRIPASAFLGLNNTLETLILENCRVTRIPSKTLLVLKELAILRLGYNNISEIPKGAFPLNHVLVSLFLDYNKIQRITSAAFSGVPNLKNLKLNNNRITTIHRSAVRILRNMTSLDLSYNFISKLPSGLFRRMRKLKWLRLHYNNLSVLSKAMFKRLRSLKYLKLEGNPILQIENRVFEGARRLRYLEIDAGHLSKLSDGIFKGLKRLRTLNLGNINTTVIPAGLFGQCDKLKYLTLVNCSRQCQTLKLAAFSSKLKRDNLNVYVSPIYDCSCTSKWISDLNNAGIYLRGTCLNKNQLSCKRRKTSNHKSRRRTT